MEIPLSIIFIIGKPILFRSEFNSNFWRIAVGPFAFWLLFHDFEVLLDKLKGKRI